MFFPFSIAFSKAIAAVSASFKKGLVLILSVIGVSMNPGQIVTVFIPCPFKVGLQESKSLRTATFELE